MANLSDVIIESQRDESTLVYLTKVLGEQRIIDTINGFTGKKRYYVSNIARVNKIEVPEHIYTKAVDKEQALNILANLKIQLGIKK